MNATYEKITRALRNAAYYDARDTELNNRAVLRAENRRRSKSKGRQRPAQRNPLRPAKSRS